MKPENSREFAAFGGGGPGQPLPGRERWVVAVVAVLGIAHLIGYGVLYFPGHGFDPAAGTDLGGGDFWVFWAAGRLAAEGRLTELYDLSAFSAFQASIVGDPVRQAEVHPFPYPPHALLMFRPLASIPYGAALAVWIAVTGALFLLAAAIGESRDVKFERTALLIGAPVVTIAVFAGQTGLLTAALFVAGFRLLERRPILAGILFGLLTFKPHLGLLIPIAVAASGQWRAIGAAAVTTVALAVLSAMVFGWSLWADYFDFSAVMTSLVRAELAGAAGTGFTGLQASVFAALYSSGAPLWVSIVVQAAVCTGAGIVVFRVYRVRRAMDFRLPVLAALTFLASPYVFFYDMPLLAFAVVVSGRAMIRGGLRPGDALALTAAWVLPLIGLAANAIGAPLSPLLVAGFALVVWRRVADGAPAPAIPARPA